MICKVWDILKRESVLIFMRSQHMFRYNPSLELFFSEYFQLQSTLFQSKSLFMSMFSNSGSLIISNMRVQSSDQHQTLLQQLCNLFFISDNAFNTISPKRVRSISYQWNTLKSILNNKRFKDIQLKMSIRASNRNRSIIAHNLSTHHSNSLTLSRIHLPRHNRWSRFILRQWQFT